MAEILDADGETIVTMRPAMRAEDNRERILDAARREFAARGFRCATLRAIACEVGVDVALIAHYFGSKQGLYTEAMRMPERAYAVVEEALRAPAETAGEALARGYLGLWEDPAAGAAMSAITHDAMTDPAAVERMSQVMIGRMPEDEYRALTEGRRQGFALAVTGLLGAAIARYIAEDPVMTSLGYEDFVRRCAAAAQVHLDVADAPAVPDGHV